MSVFYGGEGGIRFSAEKPVAALTVHRTVIHYRLTSFFTKFTGCSALLVRSTAAGGTRTPFGARDFTVRKA